MSAPCGRKHLGAEGLLRSVRRLCAQIRAAPRHDNALVDHLLAGRALFELKHLPLRKFEHDRRAEATLRALYKVARVPSNTRLPERHDALDPAYLQPLYTALLRRSAWAL